MSLIETPLSGAARRVNYPSIWTDERIAELTRLWEFERMTATQCAAVLSCFAHCQDGGRSAVIGKVHRLNLETRTKPVRLPEPRRVYKSKPRGKRTQYLPQFLPNHAAEPMETRKGAQPVEPAPAIFAAAPCSLLDLDDETCHWPNGEHGKPDFHFCGGPVLAGKPYCKHHARIAYQRRG